MTEFNDPLRMIRSMFSHVDAMEHPINLVEDSRRRWFGFSCAGCNEEYMTWICPAQALEDRAIFEYDGEDAILLNLMMTNVGRSTTCDAVNRHINRRTTSNRLRAGIIRKPGQDSAEEIKMLENLFLKEGEKQVFENEELIIKILADSFRSNIPSRYNRDPVI